MDIPSIKRFATGNRVYVRAQQIWLILVAHVMTRPKSSSRTITYGDLAEKMGYPNRRAAINLSRPLGIVAEYCRLNNLPALGSIVVNDVTGDPGHGVLVRDGYEKKIPQEQADVFKKDWFSFRVPTTGTFRKVWETF